MTRLVIIVTVNRRRRVLPRLFEERSIAIDYARAFMLHNRAAEAQLCAVELPATGETIARPFIARGE